jgi:methylated-DNA-[protein]-cysteine S-methyltransferase
MRRGGGVPADGSTRVGPARHTESMYSDRLETPIGPLTLAASDHGLTVVEFPHEVHPRAEGDRGKPPAAGVEPTEPARRIVAEAARQLAEYFEGGRRAFDLPLDWTGVTGLRLDVLLALEAEVAFGATTTYGALAKLVGNPTASRAVGGIMGSNPLPIVVPCHRVLAADGLGGFGGGLATKEWLLAWEGVIPQPLDFAL